MNKLMVLMVLISALVVSCSYFSELNEIAENEKRERGWRCRYNYRGEIQHCGYIN